MTAKEQIVNREVYKLERKERSEIDKEGKREGVRSLSRKDAQDQLNEISGPPPLKVRF
jgi:hypothetical protein